MFLYIRITLNQRLGYYFTFCSRSNRPDLISEPCLKATFLGHLNDEYPVRDAERVPIFPICGNATTDLMVCWRLTKLEMRMQI